MAARATCASTGARSITAASTSSSAATRCSSAPRAAGDTARDSSAIESSRGAIAPWATCAGVRVEGRARLMSLPPRGRPRLVDPARRGRYSRLTMTVERRPASMLADEAAPQFTAHRLTRDELHGLMERSDGPALARLAWHLGFLAVTGGLILALQATVWVIPLIVVHGYALAFLFCPFHECAHRTAFRTRWLNVACGRFIGVLIFRPYDNYRVYHWDHHRFTQDPDRDPELSFPKPTTPVAYLLNLTGLPYLRRRFADMRLLVRGRAERPWVPAHEHRGLIIEARAHLAIYLASAVLSLSLGSWTLAIVWFLPFLVGQVFMQPYLLAEHTGCAHTRDSLTNTRTTLTWALVRLF